MTTAARKRVSTSDALRRLAQKDVASAYKRPRGNQDLDQRALDHERRRLEAILA